MKHVFLDGSKMDTLQAAQQQMLCALDAPFDCGHTLDALFDVLTQITRPTHLVLRHRSKAHVLLGADLQKLQRVLYAAAQENPNLSLRL